MATSKPKADSLEELEQYFSFKIGDVRYVMPIKTEDVLTPGWVRLNRGRDEVDYLMTLLEALAGGDEQLNDELGVKSDEVETGTAILKALDRSKWKEHREVQEQLGKHMRITLGE